MSSFSPWPAFEKKVYKIQERFGYSGSALKAKTRKPCECVLSNPYVRTKKSFKIF
jgi:hypothetical protein